MEKGTFTQVFSAATALFMWDDASLYRSIYNEYLGIQQDPPEVNPADYPWPDIDTGSQPWDSPFTTGQIRIGVYPRDPYYYYEKGATEPCGFEYEFCLAILEKINEHYGTNLQIAWKEVLIPAEELPFDGTDATVISAYLEGGLVAQYDMVMSGILTRCPNGDSQNAGGPGAPQAGSAEKSTLASSIAPEQVSTQPVYDFCAPYAGFNIALIYSGLGGMELPQGDLDAICKDIAGISTEEEPIIVTHTNSLSDPAITTSQQTMYAYQVIDKIKENGHAISQPRLVQGIIDGVNFRTVHLYVGDIIQIRRWAVISDQVQNLEVKMMDDIMCLAPYTKIGW